MNLSTTTMLAILDGHGSPQERQEMRRMMQAAGVDAPLQRWRAVGLRLELTLLNGKVIYLPESGGSPAELLQDEAPGAPGGAAAPASAAAAGEPKPASKRRKAGSHGLHP